MPEGDTIHHTANRIRPLLVGEVPQIDTPHPRFGRERWAERLSGRAVTAVDARGKHLLIRFGDDRVVHSHLRMTGHWGTYRAGQRWGRSARRAWLVLRARDAEVVQFDGPVLELLTAGRARVDQRMAGLGPDIVAQEAFDEVGFLGRLRADDPTRPFGDALLDQRTVAGLGNLWKCEACFEAGIDPWRPTGKVGDDEALSVVRAARPRMQQSARDGHGTRHRAIYGRAGHPCPRCGALIRQRGQWDDNRPTFWCSGCQR
ncbi:MAG TPA: DNA-formamidopyrimidine glycosylase family protein [Solirubrobacteraceae bacterium]|nr:DNA-formamidopyrimidine glycosylase family protein [Solirubrobacteraceae bacterium]